MKKNNGLVFLLLLGMLYASAFFDTSVSAHQSNLVSYSNIEIENNKVLFLNLPNSQTHLFYAGYPDTRQEIKDTILVFNNTDTCELDNFLTHSKDAFSSEPYFFVATCKKNIETLTVVDKFPLDTQATLIYNVSNKDHTLTFSGISPTQFSVQVNKNELVAIATPERLLNILEANLAQENQNLNDNGDATDTNNLAGKNANSKSITQGKSAWQLFTLYVKLGLEHILLGIDHIFFILGFLLLAHSFSGLLKGITGFTVSHSITLTLAALSLVTISPYIVEPLIALSIAVVGALAILNIVKSWITRFGIIFGFGLFHGLGFAGSIAEVGFPKEGFVASLLGFNIGIELGQLMIVCVVYPLLDYLKIKSVKIHTVVVLALSYAVTTGGVYWTIKRLFFK